MRRTILLMSFFICAFFSANAQISTDEEPVSFREGKIPSRFSVSQDIRTMPALDMNRIEQEDAKDEANGLPPRFGYPHEVSLNLENSGRWQELSNGDRLWQLTIRCPQALSINLLYDRFWLPEGGKFFVYTTDRKHSIGAFTSINNKGGRDNVQGFATGLLYGDEVTLEYYQPKQVAEQAIISIAYVVQGYRYIELPGDVATRDFGGSQNCHVNINCPEGRNWQREKNAVAMILVNGIRYCTGSLINTTANDNRPLLLTADHCLGGPANNKIKYDAINNPILNHWSFWWHYEAPGCGNISKDLTMLMTSGAIVLANNVQSDFALLELTENPRYKRGVTPYYLGWDYTERIRAGGVCIHHPNGDVKKISTYTMTPKSESDNWSVIWGATKNNNHGVTEGGSSGAPLLSSDHKVIGQLYGGFSRCTSYLNYGPNEPDYFGKFSTSWTGRGNPDSRRRLKDWLDPLKTGSQTLNGIGAITPVISGPNIVCGQATYTVKYLPSGSTVQWSASNGNMQLVSGQGTNMAVFQKRDMSRETLIKATINPSGLTATYRVCGGSPTFPFDIIGMENNKRLVANAVYDFEVSDPWNSDYVQWAVEGGEILRGQGTPYVTVRIARCCTFRIQANKRNSCGWSFPYSENGSIISRTFTLSPNPATDVVTLRLTECNDEGHLSAQGSLATRNVYEIQLWNGVTMLKSFKTNQVTFQISLSGLPIGLYFVRVIKDGQMYSEKIIKN